MYLRFAWLSFFAIYFIGCTATPIRHTPVTKSETWQNSLTKREMQVTLYQPRQITHLEPIIISACYQCGSKEYSFLANPLVDKGFVVIGVQHDLPTDPPIARTGNLYELRMPSWKQGVENVQFIAGELARRFPQLDAQQLILMGHSHGGDVSMLFAQLHPNSVQSVISLDHRRMPIPRISKPRLLSIRADEFEADQGVLPSVAEQNQWGIRIVHYPETKHGDLSDIGSDTLKKRTLQEILSFLNLFP